VLRLAGGLAPQFHHQPGPGGRDHVGEVEAMLPRPTESTLALAAPATTRVTRVVPVVTEVKGPASLPAQQAAPDPGHVGLAPIVLERDPFLDRNHRKPPAHFVAGCHRLMSSSDKAKRCKRASSSCCSLLMRL
jgi:hypothetical protein